MTRRDAFDLAGIGVSVFSDARARRAGADRRAAAGSDTVLITGAVATAPKPVDPRIPPPTIRSTSSIMTVRFLRSTTRSTWCRSANICRSSAFSNASDCRTSPRCHGGFLSGDRRRRSQCRGAPKMLPLICYEAIFPDEAVPRGERPGWLVNVTNDGWFGMSTGPYQHFQQARVLRDRRRPAAGARRQHRHLRRHRSARAHRPIITAGNAGRA